jgi:hypothetical protein
VSKPKTDRLVVVTASLNVGRAMDCIQSWRDRSFYEPRVIVIHGEMGVVPAFAKGIDKALGVEAAVIACLHDDVLIEQDGWDLQVLDHFDANPQSGLVGFGGGRGLADADIYQKPYETHQLARVDFISNMKDAEAHGKRARSPQRVACLDGFSQIGRASFWRGRTYPLGVCEVPDPNLMSQMFQWGITHHAYDSALGAWAKRLGWEVWMLPVRCHHFGGRTAVGDPRYAEWAETVVPGGDATFHTMAHQIVYEQFRAELPIRV